MTVRRYWQEESGVRQLVDDVEYLSAKLGRPVCSKDLAEYYREFPGERPDMLQALGQQLIKATYERRRRSPTLSQIGIIGNCAYYAPDLSPGWLEGLRLHGLSLKIARQITLSLPTAAQALLRGEHGELARSALRGFIDEYAPISQEASLAQWRKLSSLKRLLKTAGKHASAHFTGREMDDLIGRQEAREVIRAEYSRRNPDFVPDGHNYNRHLAILKWPQTSLFPERTALTYSMGQVLAYCAARWPQSVEERIVNGGLWRCLAYGELRGSAAANARTRP